MEFRNWLEIYSRENGWLKAYLASKSVDIGSFWPIFLKWKGSKKVLDRLKIDREELELKAENGDWEDFYRIEADLKGDEKQSLTDDIMRHDSADAPTWAHLDYAKVIPRNTWLVHFSDYAGNIASKGFLKGVEDMTRLGLTNHLGDGMKSGGGYSFAFEAGRRDVAGAARNGKYGKHAVLFQASGILAYHSGDQENQVIFWGPAISAGSIIQIYRGSDGWCVTPRNAKRECLYASEDFEKAVNWAIRNHDQYRKQLFEPPTAKWYDKERKQN